MFRSILVLTLACLAGYYWRDVFEFIQMFQGWYALCLLPLAVIFFSLLLGFWALALCLDDELDEERKTNMADATRHYWDN